MGTCCYVGEISIKFIWDYRMIYLKEDIELKQYLESSGCLVYSENSKSKLRWGTRRLNRKKGDIAGSLSKKTGYWTVNLLCRGVKVHLIVWLLHGNDYPEDGQVLDHINGLRWDNRIENLRCVTRSVQNKNCQRRSNNTSGVTGVSYHSKQQVWSAQWVDANGYPRSKTFSEKVHGKKEAKRLAIEARKNGVEQAGDYSKRHGKMIPGRKRKSS